MEHFTYVKRGYDPEEVDRYISTLEQVIKSYKEKDNAIKNAIISAQVAADNMVKNAKAQADEYKGRIAKELDKITEEVDRQRMKIKAFQDVYKNLVKKYLSELEDNDISDLMKRLDDVDTFIARLKEVDIVPAPTPAPYTEKAEDYSDYAPKSPPPAPVSSFGPAPRPAPSGLGGMSPGMNSGVKTDTGPRPPFSQPPAPVLSLGPSSSPSLNKNPMGGPPHMGPGSPKPYAPPQVVARINDDGNYVPSS
ncbi:MAG: hypothetical protein LBI27_04545 [Clostridiales bacterium]|nr:hypothetical protein [Clostridiales bacterium]